MPIYLYCHPKTGECREIVQRMLAEHRYFDDDGLEWVREFTIPKASIDTQIDPFNKNDYLDKTKNKHNTLGDLWDTNKELSEKRAKIEGIDSVKERAMQKYEKKCKKPHPERAKKKDTYWA